MKNRTLSSILAAAILLVIAYSCSKEENVPEGITSPATISATIADLSTKVSFLPGYDATYGKPESMALTWAKDDKLRVYNHDNRSQYSDFTLDASSIGQKTGRFNGELVAASSYDVEIINGSFSYSSQTQPSDGVTTGLKYMASAFGLTELSSIVFSEFSSILAITAQMPTSAVAANIKSLEITASNDIFDGSNSLTVTLDTPGDAGSDGLLHFFATLPKGSQDIPAGTTMLVRFNAPGQADHTVYTRFIELPAAKTFTENTLNTINISAVNSGRFANTSTADIGTSANPYLIGDVYQMLAMRDLLETDAVTWFRMIDDVDLGSVSSWVPLSEDNSKGINFNGDGHTISNLTTTDEYKYPSFIGFLYGMVKNVTFDGATITTNDQKDGSAGVVAGYIGGSSRQGDCIGVTIRNSSVTSAGGAAYVGGLGARVGKGGEFRNCHVINTSVSVGTSGSCPGGLLSYIASNAPVFIINCSAEDITVTGGGHYAGGLVAMITSPNPVTISNCHTSGEVNRSSSGRHFGGLVGSIQSAGVQILNSYSTCSVTGYQFNGGLVGSWWGEGHGEGGVIDHCFASGVITDKGNSGDGGLVGTIDVPGVTVKNSIAWNSEISPNKYGEANYSSGAVVGRAHPNTNFRSNYRNPAMSLTAYWAPGADFDHPDSKKEGDTYYSWRIGADLVEANGAYNTGTAFADPLGIWAYHGKHLASGTKVSPDDKLGWTSGTAIPVETEDEEPDIAEAADYTGKNVWGLGTTVTIRPGVEYTNFHGTWQGQVREINIIRTTLDGHNSLGMYFDYGDTYGNLDEKCELMDAIAGTNGSMACCQFSRVDDIIMHPATDSDPWIANCAITIDGEDVDIVKVKSNADATMLPNRTVGCGGPLLVWKGNLLTASQEWKDADTDKWLTSAHPRTAIGLLKDGKTVIQVTVDGRWESSNTSKRAIGMSTDLLGRLMKELGCYKAMNLDGGGGAAMWVYGQGVDGIVNHPHNEPYTWTPPVLRKCGNALYIKSDLK